LFIDNILLTFIFSFQTRHLKTRINAFIKYNHFSFFEGFFKIPIQTLPQWLWQSIFSNKIITLRDIQKKGQAIQLVGIPNYDNYPQWQWKCTLSPLHHNLTWYGSNFGGFLCFLPCFGRFVGLYELDFLQNIINSAQDENIPSYQTCWKSSVKNFLR